MLSLDPDESITTILPVKEFSDTEYVFMATANAVVKVGYQVQKATIKGVVALALDDGDELIAAEITNGNDDIMLFSNAGKVVRFNEGMSEQQAEQPGMLKVCH